MKKLRMLLTAALALTMLLSLTACGKKTTDGGSGEAKGDLPIIGVNQYGQHASLDNCREGLMRGLSDAGLTEGIDYVLDYQNAGFDDALSLQIAQSFSAKNVKLMVGIATPAAVACYAAAEDKDIPVIFNAVNDPVQAKLDKGNVTGTSDQLPVEAQLSLIRELQPEAKTIGIVYTTSEPNSVSTIAAYQAKAAAYGFTIEAVGVTAQSEVTQAVDTLISRKVDCLSNLTDNNVVGVLAAILEKTNEAGIPVYGSEVEQVKLGCVASAGIDYVELGRMTGLMAAKVFKGEATCDSLPYQTVEDFSTYINSDALDALGVTVPDDIAAAAVEATAA